MFIRWKLAGVKISLVEFPQVALIFPLAGI
jgi:hypothetical protein